MDKIYLYLHPEGYDSIFGVRQKEDEFIPASIHHLRADLYAQKETLKRDAHPDGFICPWGSEGELLVVNEGGYIWVEQLEDYVCTQ